MKGKFSEGRIPPTGDLLSSFLFPFSSFLFHLSTFTFNLRVTMRNLLFISAAIAACLASEAMAQSTPDEKIIGLGLRVRCEQ